MPDAQSTNKLISVVLVRLGLSCVITSVITGLAAPAMGQPTGDSPVQLIASLQSHQFSIRQKAMFEIMENPEPFIPLIESTIESADADFRIRTLKILEQSALEHATTHSQSNLAFDLIRRLSLSDNDSLSHRASQTSFDILLCQQHFAALRLERLNARITYESRLDNETYPLASHLMIGEKWKGTRQDLEQVRLLFGLSTIELCHSQVDDDLVSQLNAAYMLSGIKLKKCSITDLSIQHLSRIRSLNDVEVLYCNVGPECFESLEKFDQLSSVRLIGTHVLPSHTSLLEQRIAAKIDIRRGAFMGIRYSPSSPKCILTSLVPGSGAEEAGLRVGDEIIEFNQTPINEYGDLTKLLRENSIGDRAKVKVIRRDEELLFEVVMGEWE